MSTKIVICWSNISGYMAACWRALAAEPGVDLTVLAFQSEAVAPFDPALLGDVRHRLLTADERVDVRLVTGLVTAERPDALCISGWAHKAYRPLASHPALASTFKIMAMDNQLRSDWRQAVGRRLLRRYLSRFDRMAVPGERSFAYARYLGFPDGSIRSGFLGIDLDAFGPGLATRLARPGGWPRRFLFVGRYAREKGIDTLVAAYAKYRAEAVDPWDLVCCGRGTEGTLLAGRPGVTDMGFVPPTEQAAVYADAGAFVLASRYEPWGVVVAEAAASGLPLVCSTACGATVEMLRDGYNGYSFAPEDVDQLCRRLHQIHRRHDLPEWGERSRAFGAAHAATLWPQRVFDGLLPDHAA